jgi:squalene cyclase
LKTRKLGMKAKEVTRAIEDGVDWLWRIRNPDKAWGDHLWWPSAVSTSIEAMQGLLRSGVLRDDPRIEESVSFVVSHVVKKSYSVLKETRNLAFPFHLLHELGLKPRKSWIEPLIPELRRYELRNHAWPLRPKDKNANIFDTAFAVRALTYAHQDSVESVRWLLHAQRKDGGWPFYANQDSQVASTCHALIALLESGQKKDSDSIRRGIEFVKSNQGRESWGLSWEDDPLHGHDKWFHYNRPWVLLALIMSGEDLLSKYVIDAVNRIIADQHFSGGWRIFEDHDTFVWATGNSLMALAEYRLP